MMDYSRLNMRRSSGATRFWQRHPLLKRAIVITTILSVLPGLNFRWKNGGAAINASHPIDSGRRFSITLSKDFLRRIDSLGTRYGISREAATYALSLPPDSIPKFREEITPRRNAHSGQHYHYNDTNWIVQPRNSCDMAGVLLMLEDLEKPHGVEVDFLKGAIRTLAKERRSEER
ncbi:MAG: hypothetical protein V1835_02440 [Candidatus Micrarchaeota archaeon]